MTEPAHAPIEHLPHDQRNDVNSQESSDQRADRSEKRDEVGLVVDPGRSVDDEEDHHGSEGTR